ncbi:hypothetical protein C8A03DRAFT_36307 [Achaetomium macrosporum]|uniref:Uncharacterized protein n=1 Tax=Achaetomium macrosporum TaxID=79813 RepID=A0AAN7C5M8_9PEZI|nr:hypothetical protein C8A03DRAFT_36307 [Achaetomium macrosporum]
MGIVIDTLSEIGVIGRIPTSPRQLHETLCDWADFALCAQVHHHHHHHRRQQQEPPRPEQHQHHHQHPPQTSPPYLTTPDAANQAFTTSILNEHLFLSTADAFRGLVAQRRRLQVVLNGNTLVDAIERCDTAEAASASGGGPEADQDRACRAGC